MQELGGETLGSPRLKTMVLTSSMNKQVLYDYGKKKKKKCTCCQP